MRKGIQIFLTKEACSRHMPIQRAEGIQLMYDVLKKPDVGVGSLLSIRRHSDFIEHPRRLQHISTDRQFLLSCPPSSGSALPDLRIALPRTSWKSSIHWRASSNLERYRQLTSSLYWSTSPRFLRHGRVNVLSWGNGIKICSLVYETCAKLASRMEGETGAI